MKPHFSKVVVLVASTGQSGSGLTQDASTGTRVESEETRIPLPALSLRLVMAWIAAAVVAFQSAMLSPATCVFIVVSLFCLVQLTRARSARAAFYAGLVAGYTVALINLTFLWTIFSVAAVALWAIPAFWTALFVVLGRACRRQLRPAWCVALLPVLWTGLEFFRSELYPLRFSWLSVGYVFADAPQLAPLHALGMYGAGLLAAGIATGMALLRGSRRWVVMALLAATWLWLSPVTRNPFTSVPASLGQATVRMAGVQLEFPTERSVLFHLDELLQKFPDTDLFVLSEYTFNGPVPDAIREWCRQHQRYLIIGGKDPLPDDQFYNTAFVIGPTGEIVFKQVKSVPIQFFQDGLPAPAQQVWESPWGKMGICVCYDLSYTRVIDRFVQQGAEAIVAPTMDVEDWGRRQHELHARVAPVRAAEYGVPIFRLTSSGISQSVDRDGQVIASAPFGREGAMMQDSLSFRTGHLPLDRWIAPFCALGTGIIIAVLLALRLVGRGRQPAWSRNS